MSRGLIRGVWIPVIAILVMLNGPNGIGTSAAAGTDPRFPAVLQRFLSLEDPSPVSYRVLRHLDARNQGLNKTAWMDVWTESDQSGRFAYTVVAQGGSGYIRSKVFLASLEKEKKMYEEGEPSRAGLTPDNYLFAETIEEEETLKLEQKEIEMIKKSLEKNKGKRKAAADELGISERTLYRKIKQFDL